jgi:hypothetical protein
MVFGRPKFSKSGVDYAKLGKSVEEALVTDYIYLLHNTRRQIWSSVIRGIFTGLGGVIGATLGVAALVALLQLFGGFPVFGQYFKDVGHTIQSRTH